jgi:hypothetical protein
MFDLVLMQVSNKSFPRELIVLSQFFLIISLSQVCVSGRILLSALLNKTCIRTKLGILNGRFLGDSLGNCTYFDARGGCSVIDYTIVSEDIFHYISYFNVLHPVETSSHCIISQ